MLRKDFLKFRQNFPFFERMEHYDKRSLDFFNKEYEWVLKDYSTATYHTLTLTEIIDSDKEFVKNNPKLFDKEFLKDHSRTLINILRYDDDVVTFLHYNNIVCFFYFSIIKPLTVENVSFLVL